MDDVGRSQIFIRETWFDVKRAGSCQLSAGRRQLLMVLQWRS